MSWMTWMHRIKYRFVINVILSILPSSINHWWISLYLFFMQSLFSCSSGDLAYFDGLNETILSVALVKPKPSKLFQLWESSLYWLNFINLSDKYVVQLCRCIWHVMNMCSVLYLFYCFQISASYKVCSFIYIIVSWRNISEPHRIFAVPGNTCWHSASWS